MRAQLQTRVRQRRLASDQRAGAWSGGKSRRLQYAYARRTWRVLALALLAIVIIVTAASLLITNDLARGVLLGAGIATGVCSLALLVVVNSGSAASMMGERAEEWTAQELRKLRSSGWQVVNHVSLVAKSDIDHVAVGPGGVVAVETKWSSSDWETTPPNERLQHAIAQARANAKHLSHWGKLRPHKLPPAEAVVFLWGSNSHDLAPVTVIDDVTVVAGPMAREWRADIADKGVAASEIEAAWAELDARCAIRDPQEDNGPTSISQATTSVVAGVLVGLLGAIAVLRAAALQPTIAAVAVGLVLVAGGMAARRIPWLRLAATSWLVGVLSALVAVLAGTIYVMVTM